MCFSQVHQRFYDLCVFLPLFFFGKEVQRKAVLLRLISKTQSRSGWEKAAVYFKPVMDANYRLVAPPSTGRTGIGGC